MQYLGCSNKHFATDSMMSNKHSNTQNRSANLRLGGQVIMLNTQKLLSIFKSGQVFVLFSRLIQSWLANFAFYTLHRVSAMASIAWQTALALLWQWYRVGLCDLTHRSLWRVTSTDLILSTVSLRGTYLHTARTGQQLTWWCHQNNNDTLVYKVDDWPQNKESRMAGNM